jgi:hypothetical protein
MAKSNVAKGRLTFRGHLYTADSEFPARLYPNADSWNAAAQKESSQYWARHRSQSA